MLMNWVIQYFKVSILNLVSIVHRIPHQVFLEKLTNLYSKTYREIVSISQAILRSKVEEITLPDIKNYHKALHIKNVWYWHKDNKLTNVKKEKEQTIPHTATWFMKRWHRSAVWVKVTVLSHQTSQWGKWILTPTSHHTQAPIPDGLWIKMWKVKHSGY